MPARVTYWTGTWDPSKEAISKEVDSLRVGDRAHAPVVSFSPGQGARVLPATRVLMLPASLWLALRACAAFVEPTGDVTHVFGGRSSWHLIRALGRRPILLTAVVSQSGGAPLPAASLAWVAVESEAAKDEWIEAGVAPERIEVIYPGLNLDWYQPALAPPSERVSLLFASTPADPAELEVRGIPLLVELARHRPDLDIVVPWRAWGDVEDARRALSALEPPPNFIVSHGDRSDMRTLYERVWGTIAPFAPGAGKICPNFVIEGLASRRPAVVTPGVGIASEIGRAGAGIVAERTVAGLSAAVNHLTAGWSGFADRARSFAEQELDLRAFRARYDALYERLRANGHHTHG